MEKFTILSSEQEKKLSLEELKEYYSELKRYLKEQEYSNYSQRQIKIRELANKLLFKKIFKIIRNYDLKIDGYENIPNTPVIYAFHHAGIVDAENVVESLPEHAMLLAGGDDLDKLSHFLLDLNGTVFVNRADKEDRKKSKIELMKALSKGKSVIVFPEAMWNMSPNKIHLPLTWGVLDMAKKIGVPVVPVAQEYEYDNSILDGKERIKTVHIRYGNPIYLDASDKLEEKILEFEENFASVRWGIWEEKGIFKRSNINEKEYKNFIECKINSFPTVDLEYEYKCVYGGQDEFYKYNFLNIVDCDENGKLLETEEIRKIKKLSK